MDIDELTWEPERLDRWLRVETGLDLMRGEAPRTRLVCFGRARPLLAVHARRREPGEDWDEHVTEALFLARSLRPAAVAVGFTIRPQDLHAPDAHLTLVIATGVRRLVGGPLLEVRTHPYMPGEGGLVDWLTDAEPPEVTPAFSALPRCALRRPTWRVRRHPDVVAQMLRERGHRFDAAVPLAARLGEHT